jgi:hypothetical protein
MKLLPVIGIVAIIIAVSACATKQTAVSAVDAAYVNRLNARLAQYNQAAMGIDAAPNSPVTQVRPAEPPSPEEVFAQIKRGAELRGRAFILDRFMKEAANSGALGFMYSWLQNQVTEQARRSSDTDVKVAAYQKDTATHLGDPQTGDQFVRLLVERGAEQGIAEELQAIFNDVRGYERDYAGAAAVDRQREEAAQRALEAYLSAPRVEVKAPSQEPSVQLLPRTTLTTCIPNIFGSVNCSTM